MKIYGGQVAEGSAITNLTVPSGTSFPSNANAGELFYRNDELKLYVHNGSTWIELSSLPSTGYKHTQGSATTTWSVGHNLNSTDLIFTVYVDIGGSVYKPILPSDFDFVNINNVTLTFSTAQSGYALFKKV